MFYFRDVKIFIQIFFYIFKSFASIYGPFHVQIVLSLSSTLHSFKNHIIARCFANFSTYLAEFSQFKFRESVQFANIVKILPCESFPLYGRRVCVTENIQIGEGVTIKLSD